MSCKPFKTSEANAKSYLRTQEVIDKYLNVKDLGKFRTEHSKLRQQAKDKYFPNVEGWNEKLFLENKQGTKVYPNKAVFKQIDKINGVKYKDSISFEPKEISEDTSFEPKEGVSDEVNYNLKSTNILLSDKANEVFKKGEKNKWPLEKILTELQVPKEQKKLILDLEFDTYYDELSLQENIAMELMNKYTYTVKINIAKEDKKQWGQDFNNEQPFNNEQFILNNSTYIVNYDDDNFYGYFKNDIKITKDEFDAAQKEAFKQYKADKTSFKPTNYYSTLTVPGGTNYIENEIATPGITPSIKGHAQFATDNGIGWFRSDDKVTETLAKFEISNKKEYDIAEKYGKIKKREDGYEYIEYNGYEFHLPEPPTFDYFKNKIGFGYDVSEFNTENKIRRILEVQSDLFQKGRDRKDLVGTKTNQGEILTQEEVAELEEYLGEKPYDEKSNQFFQLLNKDNNWVNFFVKSVIQDSAKKGYKKVLFPSGNTSVKIESPGTGINTIEEAKNRDEKNLANTGLFYENVVANVLKKQGYNPVVITDEYGNTWNEVTIDEQRDLKEQISFDPKEESDVDEFVDDEFNFDDLASEYAASQEQKTQEEPGLETDDTLDDEIITNFDKVLNYKKSLRSKIKDRIANVQNLIKNAETKEDALSFARKENQLQERLDQLENDIADTESGYSYGKLKFQAQQDLQRLQTLLQSENVNDINEAKRIINFYKAMSFTAKKVTLDNDPINSHPIFFEEEIFDADGKMQLPQQTVDFFENLSKAFSGYENQLDQKQKRALENIINSHPTIKELYTDELTYKHLTTPTNDISWVDMMIMDPSKNVSSSNLIPQIMMDITQRIFAEKISKAKAFEEKHNKALTKAEKALKAMGQVLSVLGLSNNASFDIFFQKSMGRNTGRLVNRYNQEFFDARASMQADFKEKLKLIRVSGLDDKVKNKLLRETYQERQEWFRENVIVFDVRRLREVREAFPDLADEYFDTVDDAHRKELIENLGSEQAYKEEVDKQIKQIKKYFLWRESNREMAFEENGVSTFEELSPEVQSDILFNEAAKSPFTGSDYYHYGEVQVGDKFVNTSMEYNISVPRRYKTTSVTQNKEGRYVANTSGDSTGYYDKKFEQIEKNKDLYEYYKIIQEQMTVIVNSFPADVQDQVFVNSLPATRKGFREMLADPNISLYKKLWNALVDFYDRIRGGFGINPQSSVSFENEDVITGKVEPTVNAEFLTNNKSKIDNLLTMELIKANNLMKAAGSNLKVKKNGTLDVYKLPQSVIKLISEKTNLPPTYEAIKAKYGERVPVGKILENSVMADIIQDSSTDLPKLIRYYNMMAAEYSARQELLPYMEMMKNHYTQIQTPKTNKQGAGVTNVFSQTAQTEGVRTRANTQMEDWFNRVILGNRDVKAFGVVDSENVDPKTAMERIGNLISGRILDKKDRELNKKLNDLINNTKDQNEIDKLLKIKASLGKQVAASAAFENLFNYIRYLGLGYNLSSGITNYMEGQIANMIIAATGDHFEPHHYYRALNIVKGSLFKSITGNTKLSTQGSRKLRVLVDRYNILQDSTNELQKASVKTSLDVLDKLGPMEVNKRTEYLNQTPLMISVMLSTEITGHNNQKSNAWDAMDMDGRLLPEFRTEENIKNWEEGQGEVFTSFKTKTSQAIGMAHGLGYDNLRGMMAKSSTMGKALTMFKTWAGTQYYTRFATERDDAELGVKGYKGRYLSHTKSSLSIMTSIVGWGFAGPMGALVTGAAGFAIGHFVGKRTGVRSNLSILGEYAFLLKALARKMIGMPVNFVGSTFTGKQVMNEFVGYEKLIKEGKLGEGKFTERDMKNMRALVTEMSLQIAWIAMALIAKSMFWDDDDEEDSPERIAHNLIVNRSLQLLSSSNMYLTPDGFTQLIGEQGVIRFTESVFSFVAAAQEWTEGNDTITRGINAGDSKTANAFYKIALPSAVRDSYFGFSKQMERQFEKTTYDDWYWDDTKKTNKRLEQQRLLLKKELEEAGIPEKQINKIVNKRLPLLKDIKDSDSKK
jgi:hypothetical protein